MEPNSTVGTREVAEAAVRQIIELRNEVKELRAALEYIADPDEHHSARARLIARGALESARHGS